MKVGVAIGYSGSSFAVPPEELRDNTLESTSTSLGSWRSCGPRRIGPSFTARCSSPIRSCDQVDFDFGDE